VYRDLVGKPEGKRTLGRPRRRWEDNIKMFRKWDVRVWTRSGWHRIGERWWALANAVMNFVVP